MLLFDASHTSHTHAQTGVQRVVRSMYAALCARELVQPITYDPHQDTWRPLNSREKGTLGNTTGAGSAHRSASWPLGVRFEGYARQLLNSRSSCPTGDALIVPEIFSAKIARSQSQLFAKVSGPRVAIFHDAIALKLPEFTPAKTVARFPSYMRELLIFDGVAAVSEDSRQSLLDYWQWLGVRDVPRVVAITNAVEIRKPNAASPTEQPAKPAHPTILCVGSIEGRKNHLALLVACEQLWAQGKHFNLHLIGLAHPQTGRAALAKIKSLQSAGCPLRYDGPVDDATLAAAYGACTFTIYPSLMEGFGLPVQESLAHGKPCICSGRGAIGEAASGGGCLTLDAVDASSLCTAIKQWLDSQPMLSSATEAALARRMKSWREYADELSGWIHELPRRR
jgi:glycosyltransferase involved in cell wall biosynthesis